MTLAPPSTDLDTAIAQFGDASGYLAVASIGLPPRAAVQALTVDLAAWFNADRDPQGYDAIIERSTVASANNKALVSRMLGSAKIA